MADILLALAACKGTNGAMTRSRLKNANTKKKNSFNFIGENTDENWENTARFWIGNDADIRRQKLPNKITVTLGQSERRTATASLLTGQ